MNTRHIRPTAGAPFIVVDTGNENPPGRVIGVRSIGHDTAHIVPVATSVRSR